MAKNVTIKWYGKADQGVMTAASALANVLAAAGKYVQASPGIDIKRCGAPATAYNRISESPIKLHSLVENADVKVILDPLILKYTDIKTSSNEDTAYIFRTSLNPDAIKEKFDLQTNKIFTLDADSASRHIALMTIVINHLTLMTIEDFKEKLQETLPGRANGEAALESSKIVDRALSEVLGT